MATIRLRLYLVRSCALLKTDGLTGIPLLRESPFLRLSGTHAYPHPASIPSGTSFRGCSLSRLLKRMRHFMPKSAMAKRESPKRLEVSQSHTLHQNAKTYIKTPFSQA
ncbi:Poly-beta-1,6-N-acetyl-D-glucosamine export protein [Striga asiatica]|uniref:Poly-beta-1,6-N-acetyl-D-glucosamine export protein n=1 Tax=Striga asiatica TaxID=4170 RepID=A0A5A7Q419_STRAF|nr:Poly-beta-1,6-N-acetyl-D-glucosamine export protein [Striga asiatica]